MTFFKIKFAEFKSFVEQKFSSKSQEDIPVCYFENSINFYFFKPRGCVIFWSSINKKELENADSFKKDFLSQAVSLVDLPPLPKGTKL